MKIIIRTQDTRENGEDFALTPYLFSVYVKNTAFGIGLCWGHKAIAIVCVKHELANKIKSL